MSGEALPDSLHQAERIARFLKQGTEPWTTVWQSWRDGDETYFACFSPKSEREHVLSNDSWDMAIGEGQPGFTQGFGGGRTTTRYLRFGNTDGFEPVTIHQDHHGVKADMLPQIIEEFRLYHNLWVNAAGTTLYKIHDDGNEELVAEVSQDEVRIRTWLLRQYQAGRQLDLVLFVDSRVHEDIELTEADRKTYAVDIAESDHRYYVSAGSIRRGQTFSRFLGKKVLPAPPKKHAGIWPYEEKVQTYPDFIIGEDEMGSPTRHTCDPDKLANYFGKNPEAPHYLTPVFFGREVLQRYYERSDKFDVEDGYLRCGGLWGIQIDNDIPGVVMVFLGDLGRDLPESERPYWQSFNVRPSTGMSPTAFNRSFLAQFADPGAPDLQFKHSYRRFNENWARKFAWSFFKPLEADDLHVLQRLRIPVNDSQPEFETQVLGLTKVLVDSLNEKEIIKKLDGQRIPNEKGISKLLRWLDSEAYPHTKRDGDFLKRLQLLRSKIAAHRKGSDYLKMLTEQGVDGDLVREVVLMLTNATQMLRDLSDHFEIDGAED